MIAVCSLGCDRKATEIHSWPNLFLLEGDYSLYFNYEYRDALMWRSIAERVALMPNSNNRQFSFDGWCWETVQGHDWRKRPQFDQDQTRLAGIVCARNMAIEYAMQTEATHLLFIDADIIPPVDIIPKLLAVDHPAVAGLVYGRGAHKAVRYVFGEKRTFTQDGYQLIEAEHFNIGFTMIAKKLFEAVRFRWGTSHYPDGRVNMTSDDPAFHLDCFLKFGGWPVCRTDVVGQHIGDLASEHGAQF